MNRTPRQRTTAALAALSLTAASLLTAVPARASTTVDTAAATFGLNGYTVDTISGSGDITARLNAAVKQPGSPSGPRIVYLTAGSYSLNTGNEILVSDHVYIVSDPGTSVTANGPSNNVLNFYEVSSAGMFGGTWNGAGGQQDRTNLIQVMDSNVRIAGVTIVNARKYGILAYKRVQGGPGSHVTLSDLAVSGSYRDGVMVDQGATAEVVRLTSTRNRLSGLQVSNRSRANVSDSTLNENGLAVTKKGKAQPSGLVGHGLGVSTAGSVTVTRTNMRYNRVCGLSLSSAGASAVVSHSNLDGNWRHGVGSVATTSLTMSESGVSGNAYTGVLSQGGGTRMSLAGVTIQNSAYDGVSAMGGGAITLERTYVNASKHSNLSVSPGSSMTLGSANTSIRARSYGIVVTRGTLAINGTGNTVSAGRLHGILIQTSSSATIPGSVVVTGNGGDGLRVKTGSKLTLTGGGTVLQNSKGAGLVVMSSGTKARLAAPVLIRGNKKHGVVVKSKAQLWMVRATFSANKGHTIKQQSKGKVSFIA